MPKTVILLIGPCSAGKTTILKMMLDSGFSVGVIKTISTKPLKDNDYLAGACAYEQVSEDEFRLMVESGDISHYIIYDENYYGMQKTAVWEALENNDIAVLGINEEGVEQYRNWLISQGINCVLCFVTPGPLRSIADLVNNLCEIKSRMKKSRSDLTLDQIINRFESAQSCLSWMFDNQGLADYQIITWPGDYNETRTAAINLAEKYSS